MMWNDNIFDTQIGQEQLSIDSEKYQLMMMTNQ